MADEYLQVCHFVARLLHRHDPYVDGVGRVAKWGLNFPHTHHVLLPQIHPFAFEPADPEEYSRAAGGAMARAPRNRSESGSESEGRALLVRAQAQKGENDPLVQVDMR